MFRCVQVRDKAQARVSPPELGGVAATKEILRSILSGADGVVPKLKRYRNASVKRFCLGTTLSARKELEIFC